MKKKSYHTIKNIKRGNLEVQVKPCCSKNYVIFYYIMFYHILLCYYTVFITSNKSQDGLLSECMQDCMHVIARKTRRGKQGQQSLTECSAMQMRYLKLAVL